MSMGLTARQAEGLSFIRAFIAEHGFAPSFKEMCGALGMGRKNSAHRLVKALEARGAIRCLRSETGWLRPRGIQVIDAQPMPATARAAEA